MATLLLILQILPEVAGDVKVIVDLIHSLTPEQKSTFSNALKNIVTEAKKVKL